LYDKSKKMENIMIGNMKYYNNFLKDNLDLLLQSELKTIKDWKSFNRNNSHMLEYYDGSRFINRIRQYLHSKECIEWVENELGVEGLVVDVQGTGEGASLMKQDDMLDAHIDFNWNNRIKMHRAVNLLIYVGECQGGDFYVLDPDQNEIFCKEPKHNSAILIEHSETISHGVKPVIEGERYAIRQFYYKSDATCDKPHQSLYWYNPEKKWYNPEKQMPTNS